MLKNSFLGRRDEPASPPSLNPLNAINPLNSSDPLRHRATPDSPRYAPLADAPPLSAVSVTAPLDPASRSAHAVEIKSAAASVAPLGPTEAPAAGAPRLTVGPNIKLRGAEINDCDTLVVEGHVEASMDSKTLEILKTGSYEGTVTIDIAEIHGKFSGNLTARKKLIVHASGWVSGVVRYGSLLVSEGGVVSGDIASIDTVGAIDGINAVNAVNPINAINAANPKGEPQSPLFAGYPSARIGGAATGVGKSTVNGVDHHATT